VTPIFADTSYFIALFDKSDAFHRAAVAFSLANKRSLLLTSAIVQELGASFSGVADRHLFATILDVRNRAGAEIVHVDEALQQRAVELFMQRPDKAWPLADCISFVVMSERGIYEAAATDRHFSEAQLVPLLRNGT
jgi:hypothetical protein